MQGFRPAARCCTRALIFTEGSSSSVYCLMTVKGKAAAREVAGGSFVAPARSTWERAGLLIRHPLCRRARPERFRFGPRFGVWKERCEFVEKDLPGRFVA